MYGDEKSAVRTEKRPVLLTAVALVLALACVALGMPYVASVSAAPQEEQQPVSVASIGFDNGNSTVFANLQGTSSPGEKQLTRLRLEYLQARSGTSLDINNMTITVGSKQCRPRATAVSVENKTSGTRSFPYAMSIDVSGCGFTVTGREPIKVSTVLPSGRSGATDVWAMQAWAQSVATTTAQPTPTTQPTTTSTTNAPQPTPRPTTATTEPGNSTSAAQPTSAQSPVSYYRCGGTVGRKAPRDVSDEEKKLGTIVYVAASPGSNTSTVLNRQKQLDNDFERIGRSEWVYNAIAYNREDDWIYGVSQEHDTNKSGCPAGHLLQIDPTTGEAHDLGAIGKNALARTIELVTGNAVPVWQSEGDRKLTNTGWFKMTDSQPYLYVANASISGTRNVYPIELPAVGRSNPTVAYGLETWSNFLSTKVYSEDHATLFSNDRYAWGIVSPAGTAELGFFYRCNDVVIERYDNINRTTRYFKITDLTTQGGRTIPLTENRVQNSCPGYSQVGHTWGKAWVYGNGDLGFGTGGTGNNNVALQIRVHNPENPTFELISVVNNAPASYNTDGTSNAPGKGPKSDLTIEKVALDQDNDPLYGGKLAALQAQNGGDDSARYWAVKVKNIGEGIASGFTVTDQIPSVYDPNTVKAYQLPDTPKLDRFSIRRDFPQPGRASVEFNGAAIPPGGEQTFYLSAKLKEGEVCKVNTVRVQGNEAETTTDNNSDSDDCGPAPDIELKKSVNGGGAELDDNGNGTVEYTLRLNNKGEAAGAYELKDTPRFAQLVDIKEVRASGPNDDQFRVLTSRNNVYSVDSGKEIGPGNEVIYKIQVDFTLAQNPQESWFNQEKCVSGQTTQRNGLYNEATVTWPGESATSWDCTDVPRPKTDLGVVKNQITEENEGQFGNYLSERLGSNYDSGRLYWAVTVKNFGPAVSRGFTAQDAVPNSYTDVQTHQWFVKDESSATGINVVPKVSGNQVNWDAFGAIKPGQEVVLVLSAQPVDHNRCEPNTASIVPRDDDTDPGNNSSTSTPENCVPEYEVRKRSTATNFTPPNGTTPGKFDVTYQIIVENNGPTDLKIDPIIENPKVPKGMKRTSASVKLLDEYGVENETTQCTVQPDTGAFRLDDCKAPNDPWNGYNGRLIADRGEADAARNRTIYKRGTDGDLGGLLNSHQKTYNTNGRKSNGRHIYTVSFSYSVDANYVRPTSDKCDVNNGYIVNTVTVKDKDSTDCTPPQKPEGGKLRIIKVADRTDSAENLSNLGVEFAVFGDQGLKNRVSGFQVGDGFLLSEQGLKFGTTYYLVETKTVPGRSLLAEAVPFRLENSAQGPVFVPLEKSISIEPSASVDNQAVVKVANVRVGDLPRTGGSGLWGIVLLGLLITGVGALAARRRI